MKRAALACALALAACGEGRQPPAPPPAPPVAAPPDAGAPHAATPNALLDELIREHVDAALAASPTTATWLGVHTYDDRLDDVSADAQQREIARLRALLARLHDLPDARLDAAHRLDRALLERDARSALFELTDTRPLERSPIRYVDLASSGIQELLARDFAPLPDRLRAIDGRLARLRALFDEARKNLRNPPEVATRKAIELAQGMRSFLADTLPKAVSAVGDDRLLAEFRAAQGDGLRALDEFTAWLQKDLLPRSKGDVALGAARLAERLRVTEGIDLPVDKLLAAGERELRDAGQRFEDLAKIVAPGKSPSEAMRIVEDDHPAEGDLIAAADKDVEQAAAFLRDHKLATVPEPRPKVVEMPPFLWGYTALSAPGPLEARRDAYFYVDPVDRGWTRRQRDEHLRALNRTQLQLDVLHEALPGHWLQREAARRAPTLMQKVARSYVSGEGWASYAAQAMLDEGFGDPRLKLAYQREALVYACRFVAAIRLHAFGAKRDDIVKIFTDAGSLDDYSAQREADRVAFDPMVMAHTLGKLELVKLRADYRSARGDAFNAGELHDKLLAHGAPPVTILRRLLLPDDEGSPL